MGTALVVAKRLAKVGRRNLYYDFEVLGVDLRMPYNRSGYTRLPDRCPLRTIHQRYSAEEITEMARSLFRKKVKQTHPDIGGDVQEFIRVCEAHEHIGKVMEFRSSMNHF